LSPRRLPRGIFFSFLEFPTPMTQSSRRSADVNRSTSISMVLDLCEAESIQMVISRQVLVEADRNFSSKLPKLVIQFRKFIRNLAPLMVEDPRLTALERAAALGFRRISFKRSPMGHVLWLRHRSEIILGVHHNDWNPWNQHKGVARLGFIKERYFC
jgi:hypothetical protein